MSKKRRDNSLRFDLRRLAYWLQVILVVVAPFVLVPRLHNYIDLPRGILIRVAAVSILILWLMGARGQERLRIARTPFDLPLLGFVLWAGLSLLWAPNIYEGLQIWVQWFACLVFFFVTANLVRNERDTLRILAALLLAGALVAVLGICQYLLEVNWVLQLAPPAATFGNRNMAAQFMVMTIPLAAAFFLLTRKPAHILLTLMVLGLLCLFLSCTWARSAWLAVAVEFFLLSLLLARDHFKWKLAPPMGKKKIKALALCAVVGFLLINVTPSGFQWRVGTAYNYFREILQVQVTSTQSGGINSRMRIWLNTLRMGQEHLVNGVGLGNFVVFYPRYTRSAAADLVWSDQGRWRRAHNDYVQIFAELGLVGLFFVGWLLFVLIKACVALLRETRGALRYLLMGVMVALGGFSVSAFFSFPFQMITPVFIFAIFLGLLGGNYSRQLVKDKNSASPRKAFISLPSRAATVGAAVAFLILLMLLPFEYNRLRADWYYRRVDALAYQENWPGVISQASLGYQYYPYRYRKDFLFQMGKAYLEMDNLDAAIEVTKEFLEAEPYYLPARHNMGLAYARRGDMELALTHFERVFEIVPEYGESHYVVAQIYEGRNELMKASEHYLLAIESDRSNSKYRERLTQLQRLIDDKQEALYYQNQRR